MSLVLEKRDNIEEQVGIGKLGDIFVKSGFFKDTRDQYQAVVKILYGRELGFSPVVSMMGVHIIDGKPSLSANLLGTLVKRSAKYNYRVVESSSSRCEIEFFENKESAGRSTFTIEDATKAGLATKQNWTRYPKAMLFSRALSAGIRLHCPDVSACPLYVPEELGAEVNEEGEVTTLPKSARPVSVTTEEIAVERPRSAASKPVAGEPGGTPAAADVSDKDARTVPVPVPEAWKNGSEALVGKVVETAAKLEKPKKDAPMTPLQKFHFRFKQELPEQYRVFADALLVDWLNANYPEFHGHISNIPAEELMDVWKQAARFAKAYEGKA